MLNHFNNSPTVGSHDIKSNDEKLQATINELEQRLAIVESQLAAKREEEKPKKCKWGRLGKFFKKIVQPIVSTVTNLMNSMSHLLNSIAKLKGLFG